MKTLLCILSLLCVAAGFRVPNPHFAAGTVSSASSPNTNFLYADLFLTMESGNVGDIPTAAIITNGFKHDAMRPHATAVYGTNIFVSSDQKGLGNVDVLVQGVPYSGDGTRGITTTNSISNPNQIEVYWTGFVNSNISAGGWIRYNGFTNTYGNYDTVVLRGGSDFFVISLNDSVGGKIQVKAHSQVADGNYFDVTNNTWYWASMLVTSQGTNVLKFYDTSYTLVGTSISSNSGGMPNFLALGHYAYPGSAVHNQSTNASSMSYDNWIVDYSTGRWPLVPTNYYVPVYSNDIAYIVKEDFEDATIGYDNSNVAGWWTNKGEYYSSQINAKYTTYKILGTQSLMVYDGYVTAGLNKDFTGATNLWVYYQFKLRAPWAQQAEKMSRFYHVWGAGTNETFGVGANPINAKITEVGLSSASEAGWGVMRTNTVYHVWLNMVQNDNAGQAGWRIYLSTNDFRPAISHFSYTATIQSNITRMQFGGESYNGSGGVIYDKVRISTNEIGHRPL
jgi:hypothetical protein